MQHVKGRPTAALVSWGGFAGARDRGRDYTQRSDRNRLAVSNSIQTPLGTGRSVAADLFPGASRKDRARSMPSSLRDIMLATVPGLRGFAISLCGNADRADDLVQETLLRAIANIDTFQPGTNMPAWMFTILRNLFRSEYRKRSREVEDADGSRVASLKSPPDQHGRMELAEFRRALAQLPPEQCEALLLVGASGFSYEEAAEICDIALGTIKSRVHRARLRLAELLDIDSADEFGPDPTTRGVLTAPAP